MSHSIWLDLLWLVIAALYLGLGGRAVQRFVLMTQNAPRLNTSFTRLLVFFFWPVIALVGWIAHWLVLVCTGKSTP